ncbi:molybdate transport system substrate-binding protein [Sanguibacter gelidistatuariae]|uniref:Molybdate transport system substrate-binding protein n=1 Tax=Sanguibacter gelidistatuariae TaxID=1814289 RepID=A0A1G6GQL7_9MICO|nr:molybdate ABC transporter substrate-binding protein [Sanguibacter gelidistatuariae]SDB84254.1 molybdate transport system substrate-binding protein [Sanguibacter gelidistatuariae]
MTAPSTAIVASTATASARLRRTTAALALLTAASLLGACSAQSQPDGAPGATGSTGTTSGTGAAAGPELTGELTVYAAASLTAAFDDLATRFEALNPALDVQPIVYDGSSTLATQIVEGAPADVFASADEKNMTVVSDAGLLADPAQLFASNTLVIAFPPGNPGGVTGLDDLTKADLSVVLCAAEVPCGAASQRLLAAAGLTVTPASEEQNVTAVLTKIKADEADAGLVYATDVAAAGASVEWIVPAGAADVVNHYPVATLAGAGNPTAAAAFVTYVLSADGQAVLAGYGFSAP